MHLFAPKRISAAQVFESFRIVFERLAVAQRIIASQGFTRRCHRRVVSISRRQRRRRYAEMQGQMIMPCYGFQRHTCPVGFAVGRIAGYVGRPDERARQKLAVDLRFSLPRIQNQRAEVVGVAQQRCIVHHLAAPRIDQNGMPRRQMREQGLVDQMIRSVRPIIRKRRMESQDVSLIPKFSQGHKTRLVLGARRVVAQYGATQGTDGALHRTPDVAHPDDAYPRLAQRQSARHFEAQQAGSHVLGHTIGVAARTVGPTDAGLGQIGRI